MPAPDGVVTPQLRAVPATVNPDGRTVNTWTYDGASPAAPIQVRAGDELPVRVTSDLPDLTTIHRPGLSTRNDMDRVPDLTTPQSALGAQFGYAFTVSHPGMHWFHHHVEVQLDTGLFAPLIVQDPDAAEADDEEAVLVLDDWTDGWGDSPSAIVDTARRNGMAGMPGMDHMGVSSADWPLGANTGDVGYLAQLISGRLPTAPRSVTSRPGRRVRLRPLHTGSDTLIIGMGERCDGSLTAADEVFPMVVVPEGMRDSAALAGLRTGRGARPHAETRAAEPSHRLLGYAGLTADPQGAGCADAGAADHDVDDGRLRPPVADQRSRLQPRTAPQGQGRRTGQIVLNNQSVMFHLARLTATPFASPPRVAMAAAKTRSTRDRLRSSRSTSTPTTPVSGWCPATTPNAWNSAWPPCSPTRPEPTQGDP